MTVKHEIKAQSCSNQELHFIALKNNYTNWDY
jgi:hypothetical protein